MQRFRNAPSKLRGGAIDAVSSAKAAGEHNRILGQELRPEGGRLYEKDVIAAKTRESAAQAQFKVYSLMEPGKCNKEVVGTRWVLTWEMVEGDKTVQARLAAKGRRNPDLKDGLV